MKVRKISDRIEQVLEDPSIFGKIKVFLHDDRRRWLSAATRQDKEARVRRNWRTYPWPSDLQRTVREITNQEGQRDD